MKNYISMIIVPFCFEAWGFSGHGFSEEVLFRSEENYFLLHSMVTVKTADHKIVAGRAYMLGGLGTMRVMRRSYKTEKI